jgi:hypothetical protein
VERNETEGRGCRQIKLLGSTTEGVEVLKGPYRKSKRREVKEKG